MEPFGKILKSDIYEKTQYWYDNEKNKSFGMNAKGLNVKKLIRDIH